MFIVPGGIGRIGRTAARRVTGAAVPAPVLFWASDADTLNPIFDITNFAQDDQAGLFIYEDAGLTVLHDSDTVTVTAPMLVSGNLAFSITPLIAGEQYWAVVQRTRGASTVTSNVVTKAMNADVTAPTLSNPAAQQGAGASVDLDVDTNEGTGTVYWVISTSASVPSAAQVKAGQMHTGAAAAASGSEAAAIGTVSDSAPTVANGAYYAHFMHEDMHGNQSARASTGSFTVATYEAEATALFARFGTTPDDTRKGHMNTLIAAIMAAGVWSKLDCFYVLAAHAEADARLNWKSTSFPAVPSASAPVFTLDQGTAGAATPRFFDTGFNPTTASSPNYTQNSACIGVVCATDTSSDSLFDVANEGASVFLIANGTTGDTLRGRVNSATTLSLGSFGSGIGHFTMSRTASNLTTFYANGASIGTNAAASTALANENLKIHGRTGNYSNRQLRMQWQGGGLSGAEEAAFHTARETYLDAIGAGVV